MLANELSVHHDVCILYPIFPDMTVFRHMRKRPMITGWIKKYVLDLKHFLLSPRWRYADVLDRRVTVRAYWRPTIPGKALRSIDVVVYFSAYQALELTKVPRHSSKAVYYVLHDQSLSDAHFVDPGLLSETYQNHDHKIALSHRTADGLRMKGISSEAVIPAGIAETIFHPGGRAERNGMSILAYYSPGEPRKGSNGVLQMLRAVSKCYRVAVSLLTPPGVRARGFVTHSNLSEQALADLYRSHSIFLFPSTLEGFGLPPLEAMACGCAIIATKVGAVEEYAQHGYSAWLCDPEQPHQLEEALRTLLAAPELVSRLATHAAKDAQRWTWRQAGRKLDAYLRSLHHPANSSVLSHETDS